MVIYIFTLKLVNTKIAIKLIYNIKLMKIIT